MNVFLYILDTLADWEIGYFMTEINGNVISSGGYEVGETYV